MPLWPLFKKRQAPKTCATCAHFRERELLCMSMRVRVLPTTLACMRYKER